MVINSCACPEDFCCALEVLGLSKMEPTGVATWCRGYIHLMFQKVLAFRFIEAPVSCFPSIFFITLKDQSSFRLFSLSKHQEFAEHLYCYLLLEAHF